jgi:hypothetical protein
MGLLDGLANDEQRGLLNLVEQRQRPMDTGLLGLHLLSAAGPSRTPMSFGQRLLMGLTGYEQGRNAEEERAARRQQQELQAMLARAQIAETQYQAQQRQAAAEAAKKSAERNAMFLQQLQPRPMTPEDALSAGGGPTPGNAARIGTSQGPDFARLALMFPEQADKLQKLSEAKNWGRDEVAWRGDVAGPDGRPMTRRESKFGDIVGTDTVKPYEMKLENFGGHSMAIDPYALVAGQMIKRTVSPDSRLSADVQLRGQDLVNARAGEANRIAAGGNVFKAETDLRKEFADLPEVKGYKAAVPAFNAIEDAARRNNPQADINLIYGLAKLYDPTSVVREGEYATIANSQAIPDWLKGQAQRLQGGGRLTPDTKAQILREARGRIGSYEREYQGAQQVYDRIATERGGDPRNVFTPVGSSRMRRVTSDADYNALPSGAEFIDPDGKLRRKP